MKEIELINGGRAIVDEEDFASLSQYVWLCDTTGYARRYLGGGKYSHMHREVLQAAEIVDHINRNKLDNRRSNLRPCTRAQNAQNISTHRDKRTSKHKGVTFDKSRSRWSADIMAMGKRLRLGRFDTEEEAASAYRAAAVRLHKEFANVN